MAGSESRLLKKLISSYLKLSSRGRYVITLDLILLMFSVYIAYALRLTVYIEQGYLHRLIVTMFVFSTCITACLFFGRIYSIVWTRASIEEYSFFLRWYVVGVTAFIVIVKMNMVGIPRSSLIILTMLGLMSLTASRALWKLLYVSRERGTADAKRTLIIGAGEAGTMLARDILRHQCGLEPLGFLDDNPELKGMSVASLKVLGATSQLRKTVISENIEIVLIAIPSATGENIKKFIKALEGLKVNVRIIPSVIDIAGGFVGVSRLRSVRLEDLLRREPVRLDDPEVDDLIVGRRILVTGAGGSIGSEICRQVLIKKPSLLLVLGHGEQSIYTVMESLREKYPEASIKAIIADVADRDAMKALFDKHRPEIVFHAAAHKHVPLMEDNPTEALRVNALGSHVLADTAGSFGADRFVMISTDKAVNPSSVMGSTKRIAERLIYSLRSRHPKTKYMAVRFGNVLGSRGSVVPKFEAQIEKGGPVTITHKEMKRYFMLIPEAVSLVLLAGSIGEGGELFVLDMGKPVRITEMAENLIRLHGYEPYKDIEIKFTGIRPGEKLYEELFYDPHSVDTTKHEKIFLSRNTVENDPLIQEIQDILDRTAVGELDEDGLKQEILALGKESEKQGL